MKKALLFVLVASLVITPVLAQDSLERDDFEEAADVETKTGATVRLLQLHQALTSAVIIGDEVLAAVPNISEELESIVTDLEAVRDDVKDELDGTVTVTQEEFLAYKDEARSLTREFRETARPFLTEEIRRTVREEAQPQIQVSREETRIRVREAAQKHAQERAQDILNRIDSNVSLPEDASVGEARTIVAQEVSEARSERRSELRSELQQKRQERIQELKQRRSEIRERRQELREQRQQRIEALREQRKQRIAERREQIQDRMKDIRDRVSDRVEVRSERVQQRQERQEAR